jgi:hypothetical protein
VVNRRECEYSNLVRCACSTMATFEGMVGGAKRCRAEAILRNEQVCPLCAGSAPAYSDQEPAMGDSPADTDLLHGRNSTRSGAARSQEC